MTRRWGLAAGIGLVVLTSGLWRPATADVGRRTPVALADLVAAGDPLASQDLRFDARFAELALAHLASPAPATLKQIAALPATDHLLRHARQFDYDVPREPEALVRGLLREDAQTPERVARCRASLAYFSDVMLADPHWVGDVLRMLPRGFRFRQGALFLTFGYDIGVALAPTASLNATHSKFGAQRRELLYYGIHELHHVGFMTYQPPLSLAELKTCADVLRFVEYATQLEGMAVYAVMERRRNEQALAGDPDYVALGDEGVMRDTERRYDEVYEALRRRGDAPVDAEAMKAIERMSGERLWYRVGARRAARIDAALGREALLRLVQEGPGAFAAASRRLGG